MGITRSEWARIFLWLVVTSSVGATESRAQSGARVVRYNAGDRPAEQWRVVGAPLLTIGGEDGDGPTAFANIAGVARLSDGSIVVADAGAQELRVFDATGRFVRRMGRRGRGPGEFDGLRDLAHVADTIAGSDRSGRLQVFAPDGGLLRSVARPTFRTPSLAFQLGWFSDWSLLAAGFPPPRDTMASRLVAPMVLARIDPTGREQVLDTVPSYEVVRTGGGPPLPVQFAATYRVVTVGNRYCGGHQRAFVITCFDRDGRALVRTERAVPSAPLPDEAREYFRTTTLRANASLPAPAQAQLREMIRLTQFADRTAAFGVLRGATTGELWVAPFDYRASMINQVLVPTSDAPQRWSVLGEDGRWIAEVTLPARFALLDAGRDWVAGVQRDVDDVERVVVLRLQRP